MEHGEIARKKLIAQSTLEWAKAKWQYTPQLRRNRAIVFWVSAVAFLCSAILIVMSFSSGGRTALGVSGWLWLCLAVLAGAVAGAFTPKATNEATKAHLEFYWSVLTRCSDALKAIEKIEQGKPLAIDEQNLLSGVGELYSSFWAAAESSFQERHRL